jgi:hypothetical protein
VVAQVPAPGRPYEAIVNAKSWNIPDPAWTISIRQTGGLTAREFEVRCVDGGYPRFNLRKVLWLDDEHLLVKLTWQPSETVLVDPTTGKPSRVSSKAWNC